MEANKYTVHKQLANGKNIYRLDTDKKTLFAILHQSHPEALPREVYIAAIFKESNKLKPQENGGRFFYSLPESIQHIETLETFALATTELMLESKQALSTS